MKQRIILLALLMLIPLIALAQGTGGTGFDVQAFIWSLIGAGGPVMLVSGWVSAQWTKASGTWMIIQTLLVALVITAAESLLGVIPLKIGEFWQFLASSLTNGVLAMILYKLGVFNSFLGLVGARTDHQVTQQ